jgi:type II secretory pathway pseudopilin PulG
MKANGVTPQDSTSFAPKPKSGFGVVEAIVVLVILVVLAMLFLPGYRSAGPAARRTQCINNLRNVALALLNYEQVYHALPPAYTVDAHGRRLHSWRALILPYLDQQALYKTIDFSKAWDDPANAKALATKVEAYHCPEAVCPLNQTTYLAIVTPRSCLLPTKARRLSEIIQPGSTAVVIEVDSDHAVHWMDPSDADESLVLGLTSKSALPHSGGFPMATMDGTVHFLSADSSPATRRALISTAEADKRALDKSFE